MTTIPKTQKLLAIEHCPSQWLSFLPAWRIVHVPTQRSIIALPTKREAVEFGQRLFHELSPRSWKSRNVEWLGNVLKRKVEKLQKVNACSK